MAWLCPRINQNANFWVEDATKCVEQPPVRVNLLAILLFETENHLDWRKVCWVVLEWPNQLLCRSDR